MWTKRKNQLATYFSHYLYHIHVTELSLQHQKMSRLTNFKLASLFGNWKIRTRCSYSGRHTTRAERLIALVIKPEIQSSQAIIFCFMINGRFPLFWNGGTLMQKRRKRKWREEKKKQLRFEIFPIAVGGTHNFDTRRHGYRSFPTAACIHERRYLTASQILTMLRWSRK